MLNDTCYKLLGFVKTYQQNNDGRSPSYQEMCEKLQLKSKASIHRVIGKLVEHGMLAKQDGVMRSLIVIDEKAQDFSVELGDRNLDHVTKYTYRDTAQNKGPYGHVAAVVCRVLPVYNANHLIPADKSNAPKAGQKVEKITAIDIFKRAIKLIEEEELDDEHSSDTQDIVVSFEPIGNIAIPLDSFDEHKQYFAYHISNDSMCDMGVLKNDVIIMEATHNILEGDCGAVILNEKTMVFKRIRTRHNSYLLQSEGGTYSSQTVLKNRARIAGKMIGVCRGYKIKTQEE